MQKMFFEAIHCAHYVEMMNWCLLSQQRNSFFDDDNEKCISHISCRDITELFAHGRQQGKVMNFHFYLSRSKKEKFYGKAEGNEDNLLCVIWQKVTGKAINRWKFYASWMEIKLHGIDLRKFWGNLLKRNSLKTLFEVSRRSNVEKKSFDFSRVVDFVKKVEGKAALKKL